MGRSSQPSPHLAEKLASCVDGIVREGVTEAPKGSPQRSCSLHSSVQAGLMPRSWFPGLGPRLKVALSAAEADLDGCDHGGGVVFVSKQHTPGYPNRYTFPSASVS